MKKSFGFLLKLSLGIMALTAVLMCTGVSANAVLPIENRIETAGYDDYDYDYNYDYDDNYDYDYDYDYSDRQPRERYVNWFKIISISFGVSVVVTVVAVSSIYEGYKHNGKTEPYPYQNKAPLEVTNAEDILVDTDVKREHIPRERR